MFGSSWPPVVYMRAHVLFTLFVFVYVLWCPTHMLLCFLFYLSSSCVLCTQFCQFLWIILIVPSVSSNVYLPMIKLHTIYDFHELLINWINLHLHKTNIILNAFTYKIESVKKHLDMRTTLTYIVYMYHTIL